jgi:hypothetical protein
LTRPDEAPATTRRCLISDLSDKGQLRWHVQLHDELFGWRDNKMPALYRAKASRDKLAISGMEKIEAYDQMENVADLRCRPTRTE